MEIPIRFKFFDKLKLYQDYLKADCMLERTKKEYWLYEKSILFWAYSPNHQHIGRPLNADVFCSDPERVSELPEIAKKLTDSQAAIGWVKENITNKPAAIHAIANLNTLGFAEVVTRYTKDDQIDPVFLDFPNKVYINQKGFLLGELLFETYENPGFWSKEYRKYKLAILVFYITFTVLLSTVFLVFFDHLFKFIKPEVFITTITRILGYSWWSIIVTCLLGYLLLRQIWKKL